MYAVDSKAGRARSLLGSGSTTLLFHTGVLYYLHFVHCSPPFPLPPLFFIIPFVLLRLCFSCCCRLYAYRSSCLFVSSSLFSVFSRTMFFSLCITCHWLLLSSRCFFFFLMFTIVFCFAMGCQVLSCVHLIMRFCFFLYEHLCHCSLRVSGVVLQCISTHPPFSSAPLISSTRACCGAKDSGERSWSSVARGSIFELLVPATLLSQVPSVRLLRTRLVWQALAVGAWPPLLVNFLGSFPSTVCVAYREGCKLLLAGTAVLRCIPLSELSSCIQNRTNLSGVSQNLQISLTCVVQGC